MREKLRDVDHDRLVDIIFSLTTLENLVSAREIAEKVGCDRRDVLRAMKSGQFSDPIFGTGYFCRGHNSFRVTQTAANEWLRRFFVQIDGLRAAITHKKKSAQSETDLAGESAGQKARLAAGRSDANLAHA